jgi:flagellar biosynthesis protein FlhB
MSRIMLFEHLFPLGPPSIPQLKSAPNWSVNPLELSESQFAIGLQWFAAEDEGRTEEPTEYKIKKAREEGKVAKSAEFSSSIVLLFTVVTIGILGGYLFENMKAMMRYFLTISAETDITDSSTLLPAFFRYFIRLTLPVGIIAFIAAIMGNLFQVGFLFTTKPLKPDLKRVAPNFVKFFKKSLFSGEALFNLAKSIAKVAAIGVIAYLNIRSESKFFVRFATVPFGLSLTKVASVGFRIMVEAAIAMLLLAIPDYAFQKKQHKESLKMSKHEVKEERKMQEGDPQVQSRLRERMRELLRSNMIRNVPNADVVVTNPTHFAVAMQWDRSSMTAPTVIAKGQDNLALRIRETAESNDVPVIENKPLARALFAEVEIGDMIPEKYYEVVALVIAEVYRMTGRSAEAV